VPQHGGSGCFIRRVFAPLRHYHLTVQVARSFPRRHAVSAHEFLEMGNAGAFAPEARLELIDGDIIDMAPMGSPHATVVRELTAILVRVAQNRAIVSPRCPLVLGELSVPQPDIALLKPKADRYYGNHPCASDALLVVEISDTTLGILDYKVPHYARAGVPEVWTIDVEQRAVRVSRNPDPTGYRTTFTMTGTDPVQPEGIAGVTISVHALFPE
jgi:Uma2 family endonuclease